MSLSQSIRRDRPKPDDSLREEHVMTARSRRWFKGSPECVSRMALLAVGRCDTSASVRSQHHHKRAHLHVAVKIDDVLVGQPYAARRNGMSDPSRLVPAVDAVERVLAARVKIERTRTHWIAGAAFDIVRKRAESPLLILGRRPSWPFFLAADRGNAGPGLSILAYDRAVADRLTFGKHVVNVACGGIDQDRAW